MADAEAGQPEAGYVTLDQLSKLLMMTGERVRQLVKMGKMPKAKKNTYHLVSCVQGYIRFLKDEEKDKTKAAAESGLKKARQREVELRIAEREKTVIDLAEHFAVVEELCGLFVSSMNGLPARVTRDIPLRRKIEIDLDEIRRQIVARAEQRSAELRAGRSVAAADPEDDA